MSVAQLGMTIEGREIGKTNNREGREQHPTGKKNPLKAGNRLVVGGDQSGGMPDARTPSGDPRVAVPRRSQ